MPSVRQPESPSPLRPAAEPRRKERRLRSFMRRLGKASILLCSTLAISSSIVIIYVSRISRGQKKAPAGSFLFLFKPHQGPKKGAINVSVECLWALKVLPSSAFQGFVTGPNMHDIMKQKVISLIAPLNRRMETLRAPKSINFLLF